MDRRVGDKITIPGDYQYNAYFYGPKPQRFWHYTKIEESIRSLDIQKNDRVLDVGCGSGLAAFFVAERYEAEVLAIDGNEKALIFARSKFKKQNLSFRLGLVDELGLPPNSLDKILFLEVIEHISEEQGKDVIKTFFSLLKPGGRLVISTPNKKSFWPLIEWVLDFLRLTPNLAEGQHEFLYSGEELKKIATDAGFVSIRESTINTLAPWLALFSWRLALFVHRVELRLMRRHGSILLYCFQKN